MPWLAAHLSQSGGLSGTGDERYARYFEWGGLGEDGEEAFAARRPGWEHGPVHQMLVDHGVSAVLRGHDHLWYDGILDSVHYTTLPKSSISDKEAAENRGVEMKGYDPARVSVQSGHTEIRVRSPTEADVVFVSYRPAGDPLAVTGLGYTLLAPTTLAQPWVAAGSGGGSGGRIPSLAVEVAPELWVPPEKPPRRSERLVTALEIPDGV